VNTSRAGAEAAFPRGPQRRTVYDLNVYLSPFDACAGVFIDDRTPCRDRDERQKVPCRAGIPLPVDPGSGPPRANFSKALVGRCQTVAGRPERTREGYFDVIG
jgi:hypothetical protein